MRLIKKNTLFFKEDTDKIYEAELCEITHDSFVVNFRYGRRSKGLQEGTKTESTVSRSLAETIFEHLINSKIKNGYTATAPSACTADSTPNPVDPQNAPIARIIEILSLQKPTKRPLSRVAWRAGELKIAQAELHLLRLLNTQDEMLDYCIVWSLGQLGSVASISPLQQLISNPSTTATVKRIATGALIDLQTDPEKQTTQQSLLQGMPKEIIDGIQSKKSQSLYYALKKHLVTQNRSNFRILDNLYLTNMDVATHAVWMFLKTAPLRPPFFRRIRHIYKIAEMRRDAKLWALLTHRMASESYGFRINTWYTNSNKTAKGENPQNAFSNLTKAYFIKRSWRFLNRIGQSGQLDYTRLAAQFLLTVTDDHATTVTTGYDYQLINRKWQSQTVYYDKFSDLWLFNQILYQNSPRYKQRKNRFACIPPYKPGDPLPGVREEAFPALWEQTPALLLMLLKESRCKTVHEFACEALEACAAFCDDIPISDLIQLLASPYEITARFSADLSYRQLKANGFNLSLTVALANCCFSKARQEAYGWLSQNAQQLNKDASALTSLLLSPHEDTQIFIAQLLSNTTIGADLSQEVISRVIAAVINMQTPQQNDQINIISKTLLLSFKSQLKRLGWPIINDLLRHPLPACQLLAGELILLNSTFSKAPPADALAALIDADETSVRRIGVRIVTALPVTAYLQNPDMLISLIRHEKEDVRIGIRPTLQKAVASSIPLAKKIGILLIEALLIPGAPAGVPSFTGKVLKEDLRQHLTFVSKDIIFKLLLSRSTVAQEIGGMLLLSNTKAHQLSTAEIVKLGHCDVLSVREAAWKMCKANPSQIINHLGDAVGLLDSKWQDSRNFAMTFIENHCRERSLPPNLLVSLCDSVRPDVQQFGKQLITQHFDDAAGHLYLLKLSEHPSRSLQLFATNYLERFATDNTSRLKALVPYFISILSQVNKGRVAKNRVLHFLAQESKRCVENATVIAEILTRQSVTCAIGDKSKMIELMLNINQLYPDIPLPISLIPVEVRDEI